MASPRISHFDPPSAKPAPTNNGRIVTHPSKRRRWLEIGLMVMLAALGIAGLSLWTLHRQHAVVRVPQSEIAKSSLIAQKLGAPVSDLPDDNTLHLIIYYDGYSDPTVAQHYVGLIEGVLKTAEPYKSLHNISVSILTSGSSRCHVQKGAKNLLICDKSLISDVNKFRYKHFKLLILSPLDFAPNGHVARGKNVSFYLPTYQGALTQTELDTFVSLYFMHEFGHTFGLRDEYIRTRYDKQADDIASEAQDSGSIAYSPAAPNCAPDLATAHRWWDAYVKAGIPGVGYYKGCAGNANDYYPVQNTVMGDDPTDATYGIVSENYIREVIECFYGNSANLVYPVGKYVKGTATDCAAFRSDYPNFWQR